VGSPQIVKPHPASVKISRPSSHRVLHHITSRYWDYIGGRPNTLLSRVVPKSDGVSCGLRHQVSSSGPLATIGAPLSGATPEKCPTCLVSPGPAAMGRSKPRSAASRGGTLQDALIAWRKPTIRRQPWWLPRAPVDHTRRVPSPLRKMPDQGHARSSVVFACVASTQPSRLPQAYGASRQLLAAPLRSPEPRCAARAHAYSVWCDVAVQDVGRAHRLGDRNRSSSLPHAREQLRTILPGPAVTRPADVVANHGQRLCPRLDVEADPGSTARST
jgi:hypothetical protein